MSLYSRVRTDESLRELSYILRTDEQVERLGRHLGFSTSQIQDLQDQNWGGEWRTGMGTRTLLRAWADDFDDDEVVEKMTQVLTEAGLESARDEWRHPPEPLGDGYMSCASLKKALQRVYTIHHRRIRTTPSNRETLRQLDEVWEDVVYTRGDDPLKEDRVSYEDICKETESLERGTNVRIIVKGQPGSGKSLLLTKMASDWAADRVLRSVDLVFYIPLIDLKGFQSLGSYLGRLLGDRYRPGMGGSGVEDFVQSTHHRTLVLLDGLEERGDGVDDIDTEAPDLRVLRGEYLKGIPVVIATCPTGLERILADHRIGKEYRYITVRGFSQDGMTDYIDKFFTFEEVPEWRLLKDVLYETQATMRCLLPSPLNVSMLCQIWLEMIGRKLLSDFHTFANVLFEAVFALQEHCTSKDNFRDNLIFRMMEDDVIAVGCVAWKGLLEQRRVFTKAEFDVCSKKAVQHGLEIKVLVRQTYLAPRSSREAGKRTYEEFSFSQPLFQEYMASCYIESLYKSDQSEFKRIVAMLVHDPQRWRMLLYCVVGRRSVEVGTAVIKKLCQEVDDEVFIVNVAVECHKAEAMDPVVAMMRQKTSLELSADMDMHTIAGYNYALSMCGRRELAAHRKPDGPEIVHWQRRKPPNAFTAAVYEPVVGMFTLPKAQFVRLDRLNFEEFFFIGLANAEVRSKLIAHSEMKPQNFRHLLSSIEGSELPRRLMRSVYSDRHRHSRMRDFYHDDYHDDFYHDRHRDFHRDYYRDRHHDRHPDRHRDYRHDIERDFQREFEGHLFAEMARAERERNARNRPDNYWRPRPDPQPVIQTPADFFYLKRKDSEMFRILDIENRFMTGLIDAASWSQIEHLEHNFTTLTPSASTQYARWLCALPLVQTLGLQCIEMAPEFYKYLADNSSSLKLEKLTHGSATLDASSSSQFAKAICAMPGLTRLKLNNVKLTDEFYATLAEKSSSSKIEKLCLQDMTMSAAASTHLAESLVSLEGLKTLELDNVRVEDEFFTAAAERSPSQIEELTFRHGSLGPAASSSLATCLGSLTKVKHLQFADMKLTAEFFTGLVVTSPKRCIEKLSLWSMNLDGAMSEKLAQCLCAIPELRAVVMDNVEVDEQFFNVMDQVAPTSQIIRLCHRHARLNGAMSGKYARALSSMQTLRALELENVELDEAFFSTASELASRSQINELGLYDTSVSPVSCDDYVQWLSSLGHLRSLKLIDVKLPEGDADTLMEVEGETESMLGEKVSQGASYPNVVELDVDQDSLSRVVQSCPRVEKITVRVTRGRCVHTAALHAACAQSQQLTQLHVHSQCERTSVEVTDVAAFCEAVRTGCPRLASLTMRRVQLGDQRSEEIIQSLKKMPSLALIQLICCGTSTGLEKVIAALPRKSKLTVYVIHEKLSN